MWCRSFRIVIFIIFFCQPSDLGFYASLVSFLFWYRNSKSGELYRRTQSRHQAWILPRLSNLALIKENGRVNLFYIPVTIKAQAFRTLKHYLKILLYKIYKRTSVQKRSIIGFDSVPRVRVTSTFAPHFCIPLLHVSHFCIPLLHQHNSESPLLHQSHFCIPLLHLSSSLYLVVSYWQFDAEIWWFSFIFFRRFTKVDHFTLPYFAFKQSKSGAEHSNANF